MNSCAEVLGRPAYGIVNWLRGGKHDLVTVTVSYHNVWSIHRTIRAD